MIDRIIIGIIKLILFILMLGGSLFVLIFLAMIIGTVGSSLNQGAIIIPSILIIITTSTILSYRHYKPIVKQTKIPKD